jgi:hypothetical protein
MVGIGVVIVVLVSTRRKPIFDRMRLSLLLGFMLVGCAHHDASLRAASYEYGRENRPYTGIPQYLRQEQKPTPPPTECENCTPDQAPIYDQERPE